MRDMEGNMRNLTNLACRRNLFIGAGFAALLGALVIGQAALEKTVAAQKTGAMAPHFEVFLLCATPTPNLCVLPSTTLFFADPADHGGIIPRRSAALCHDGGSLEG